MIVFSPRLVSPLLVVDLGKFGDFRLFDAIDANEAVKKRLAAVGYGGARPSCIAANAPHDHSVARAIGLALSRNHAYSGLIARTVRQDAEVLDDGNNLVPYCNDRKPAPQFRTDCAILFDSSNAGTGMTFRVPVIDP